MAPVCSSSGCSSRITQAPQQVRPPLYAARPVSSIGALHLYESSGGLKSYGLQTALRGDLTRYFKGMVMYELGRASNDTDGIGAFPANNWNLNGEWARASFDVRHYIYLYGTVDAGFALVARISGACLRHEGNAPGGGCGLVQPIQSHQLHFVRGEPELSFLRRSRFGRAGTANAAFAVCQVLGDHGK